MKIRRVQRTTTFGVDYKALPYASEKTQWVDKLGNLTANKRGGRAGQQTSPPTSLPSKMHSFLYYLYLGLKNVVYLLL